MPIAPVPILLLVVMAGITAIAWAIHELLRTRHRNHLRLLARQWQMHYAPHDHFNIAGRIAEDFPVPGAADLRVLDLIYASDARHYCYIFTAEYTIGVIETQRRQSRVMSFCEAKEAHDPQQATTLSLGQMRLSLLEQYRQLKASAWPEQNA
jgi:hypothetical protein